MILLLVYVGIAVGFSFLCSLLEASFLSARIATLMERKEAGDKSATLLLRLKQERVDDALSAILILNTMANTLGATLAGAQAKVLFDDFWVGVFTIGLVLLILLGSEIVPKTLGAVYAMKMVPFTAHATRVLVTALAVLLYGTRVITQIVARRRTKHAISRRELAAMVAAAARDGTLPAADSLVVSNVLSYHEIKVADVMTPRTVIAMLPAGTTIAGFLEDENCRSFSRIPLFEDNRDNVVGYVLQREVLSAAARGMPRSTPLVHFLRKALYLPETQTVGGALRHLTERREHLAFVTDEYGGISGLVSLEDLMETTLGIEILDESDRVADLRAEAIKLRDRRLREYSESRQADSLLGDSAGAPEGGAPAPPAPVGKDDGP